MALKVGNRVIDNFGHRGEILLIKKGLIKVNYDEPWRGRTIWGIKAKSLKRIKQLELNLWAEKD